jgi:hypothetical protein
MKGPMTGNYCYCFSDGKTEKVCIYSGTSGRKEKQHIYFFEKNDMCIRHCSENIEVGKRRMFS